MLPATQALNVRFRTSGGACGIHTRTGGYGTYPQPRPGPRFCQRELLTLLDPF